MDRRPRWGLRWWFRWRCTKFYWRGALLMLMLFPLLAFLSGCRSGALPAQLNLSSSRHSMNAVSGVRL